MIEAAAIDSWVRNVDFMAGSLQPTVSTIVVCNTIQAVEDIVLVCVRC